MRERLKRNICNLDDYVILNRAKDLSTHWKFYIGDALEYACQFWTKHLLSVPRNNPCVQEVQEAIDQFFTIHLLHWIEVLVLVGNLNAGICAINDIGQWYLGVSAI